ncbi:MAG: nitrate reductase molybdenum cofactor assembly chaperone [Syntrophobacteraceae bacterium]
MTESSRLLFKLLSVLLHYPDSLLMDSLGEIEALSAEVSQRCEELIGGSFLPYLRATPLLRAQEYYTRTFDLSPTTCLYLSWHRLGESKERGAELARLSGLYRSEGLECVAEDLPDYLPMILEFASICPGDGGLELLRDFSPEIEKLRLRLKESQSPYEVLFALLSEVESLASGQSSKERL